MSVKKRLPVLMILALLCWACSLEGNIFDISHSVPTDSSGPSVGPGGDGDGGGGGGVPDPVEELQWANTNWYYNNPYASDFYISTPEELAGLSNLVNKGIGLSGKTIHQTNDIDLSVYDNWMPIGIIDENYFFTGIFDGGGYTISNLTIYRFDDSSHGLFGRIMSGAVVKNLKLINVNINGNYCIGSVVGLNLGIVENCYVEGNVSSNYYSIGGIVGDNMGMVNNCSFCGNVSGNENVGGVVGLNFNGTIEKCYAIGNVFGYSEIGGIVGLSNYGIIKNCVALNDTVTSTYYEEANIGRVTCMTDAGTLQNNYSNLDMVIKYNTYSTYIPADTIHADDNKDGADVSPGTNAGQCNNQSWWIGTVGFDFSASGPWKWDDVVNLPILK